MSENDPSAEEDLPLTAEELAAFKQAASEHFAHVHELPPMSRGLQARMNNEPPPADDSADDAPLI